MSSPEATLRYHRPLNWFPDQSIKYSTQTLLKLFLVLRQIHCCDQVWTPQFCGGHMETSCMAFLTKLLSAVYDSLLCFNIEYKISTYLA